MSNHTTTDGHTTDVHEWPDPALAYTVDSETATVDGVNEQFDAVFGQPSDSELSAVLARAFGTRSGRDFATDLVGGTVRTRYLTPSGEDAPLFLARPRLDGDGRGTIQFVEVPPGERETAARHTADTRDRDENLDDDLDQNLDDDLDQNLDQNLDDDLNDDLDNNLDDDLDGELVASIVAHDLRNPLDVAKANLRVGREDDDEDCLESVADAHDRMEGIIEDVLMLARTNGPVDRSRVNLSTAVQAAWNSVPTERATLSVESDLPVVEADRDGVERLFENLFRNATEHTDGEPTIRTGSLQSEAGFYVADDGPGIPASKQDDVFELGYTSGSGTGLGLTIVQRIADAHDWEITLDEDAPGARFEITGLERIEQ
jgi:signal transduction histidine kinase